ncbi:MAG: 3-hydroxyacyl-CoA dehydrogenase family protein [Solirubrobacterales bacterium]|nr:3-hydroxyacyl-CoA dehydrogenase family protein [Solirubrobacterales bacterium]
MEESLAVVGGGAIACGLAAVAARHGEVVLWTRSEDSAGRAARVLSKASSKVDDGAHAHRVRVTTELREIEEATFVVESIAEQFDAKRELFARLGPRLRPNAVLATTTSSLSVTALAEASTVAERFVGLHVFNPVPKMELVELAFPLQATEETRSRARALIAVLGKHAVEVPDTPGFVVNRLLFAFLFDAVCLVERTGMTAEKVDACMTMGAGHPMGPLALLDYVGLDVSEAIGDALGLNVPDPLRRLVAEGALGRKSGRGFHEHG